MKTLFVIALLCLSTLAFGQGQNFPNGGSGGGGSGTVSNATAAGNAYYSAAGTTVQADTNLVDNGNGTTTSTQGAIAADAPWLSNTATLNSGATAFHGILQNWTCTAASNGTQALALGSGGTQFLAKYNTTNCGQPFFQVNGGTNTASVMSGVTIGPMNSSGAAFYFATQTSGITNDNATNGNLALVNVGSVRFRLDSAGDLINNGSTYFRGANSCYITSAVTGSTSPTTICSWSLPAIAYTWAYKCDLLWQVSAGTSPTLSLGINASQTPTSETGMATILTTNTGTQTNGSATATASGNQNILTTGTLTTSATNFQASTSGTVQASATAGTFAVTFTLGGTTPTGQISPGSNCILY